MPAKTDLKLTVKQEAALLNRRQMDAFDGFQIEGAGAVLGSLKKRGLIDGGNNRYHLTELGRVTIERIEAGQ